MADLSEADLRWANLTKANLSMTDMHNADLSEANLILADLTGANLHKVNLSRANLSGANLSMVSLGETNLNGANLSGADLNRNDLSGRDLRGLNLNMANLSCADLRGADLRHVNLSGADLRGATLSANISRNEYIAIMDLTYEEREEMDFKPTDLRKADLSYARLDGVDLSEMNLRGVILRNANLSGTNLTETNLTEAALDGANLSRALLVQTNLHEASLTNCLIYGISVWNVQLEGAKQYNLVITPEEEPTITVDNLKVAQFIYLLLNNAEIRDVIDTIAKKAVLILGRFTPERKSILEAIRAALRTQGYLPILFDFPKPDSQDLTGTVSTLANISRFIIADLTDPSCSPYEIGLVAPYMKPIKPLFQPSKAARYEFAMFQDLRKRYPWVLPVYRYKDHESLLASLQEKVIVPTEQRVQMLEKKKQR